MVSIKERAQTAFRALQDSICEALCELERERGSQATFSHEVWTRDEPFGGHGAQGPGQGGGGESRTLAGGAVFEKAGVNFSRVEGFLDSDFASQIPGQGTEFFATGVSLVLHPLSPMVPTVHANFRFLEKGDRRWFGGGADLTPHYFFRDDAVHFHQVLKDACDRHPAVADYARFKATCDDYFYLRHRKETRGIGGVFFDYLEGTGGDLEPVLAFVEDIGGRFCEAYVPIVRRRIDEPYGEAERTWQLRRRGRYVEFNLLFDRGTVFGLKTGGRVESILMSLPPLCRWDAGVTPAPGSREAEMCSQLKAQEWLG